jgi:hypothetical protein
MNFGLYSIVGLFVLAMIVSFVMVNKMMKE